jgi:hypothetical protein
MVKKSNVDYLKTLVSQINATQKKTPYLNEMRQVIDLYVGRQIEKFIEAKNTIIKLSSKSKKTNIVGLERVAKSKEALPATGKLTRITSKRAERQNYFVQGTYDLQQVFRKKKKEVLNIIQKHTQIINPIQKFLARRLNQKPLKCLNNILLMNIQ